MIFRPVTNEDLNAVILWITDKEACKLWAGPLVRFPLSLERLKADIEFSKNNTFAMIDDKGELLGFVQLQKKEKDRIHIARVIVSTIHRGKGFGDLLCRLLIDEGINRFGKVYYSLNVYYSNTKAAKLYQKLGFEPKPAPPNSIPDKDIIHMVLNPDHRVGLCSKKNTEI